MDSVRSISLRLVAALLPAVLLLYHLTSWAYICTQYRPPESVTYGIPNNMWMPSGGAACSHLASKWLAHQNTSTVSSYTITAGPFFFPNGDPAYSMNANTCAWKWKSTNRETGVVSGENSDGSQIITRTGDYCTDKCNVYSGVKAQTTFTWAGTITQTPTLCIPNVFPGIQPDGCKLIADASQCYTTPTGTQCQGGGTYTGVDCDSSQPAETNRVAASAPQVPASSTATSASCEGYFGQVNGVDTCIPSSPTATKSATTASSTASSPTGTTTGSETSTKVTSCTGTTCTTTTTTVNSNGTTTTTNTSQDKGTFCAANAQDKMCGGDGTGSKSAFGGSCTAGFTCSGDAAMCAAAKATWMTQCHLQTDKTISEVTGYENAKSALQTEVAAGRGGTGVPSEEISLSPDSFDQTDLLNGTSCIADRQVSFNVGGQEKSISFPFSKICEVAALLGNILLAASFIVATGIVLGGMKG